MKQNQNARHNNRARSTGRGKPTKTKHQGMGNRRDQNVKGNPKQFIEKYKTQARDAAQSGDRVMEHYYYQFADHYQRILNEMQPQQRKQQHDDQPKVTDSDVQNADEQSVNAETGSDQNSDSVQEDQQEDQKSRRGRGRTRHRNRQARSEESLENSVDNPVDDIVDSSVDDSVDNTGDTAIAVDPSQQEQPKMEYPEEMLKEIPVAVKKDIPESLSKTESISNADRTVQANNSESNESEKTESIDEKPAPKRRGRPRKAAVKVEVKSETVVKKRVRKKETPEESASEALNLPLDDKGDGEAA